MGIYKVEIADTSILTLIHPGGSGAPLLRSDGSPMTITLTGRDGPAYRQVLAEFQAKMGQLRRMATPQELLEHAIKSLAACTVAWTIQDERGHDLPCSPEYAAQIYAQEHWLREQVDAFVGDRANFTRTAWGV